MVVVGLLAITILIRLEYKMLIMRHYKSPTSYYPRIHELIYRVYGQLYDECKYECAYQTAITVVRRSDSARFS